MPHWTAPPEIVKDADVLQKLSLVMLGLCSWEIIVLLPFDWSFITRKREARWPSFFYFYCRYSLWIAVIGINTAINVRTKVNCQALYTSTQFAGNTSIGSASTLLVLRTIAVWNHSLIVTVPLLIASLGQWGILFYAIAAVRSSWNDAAGACAVKSVSSLSLELVYLYTLLLDLVTLLLTTIKLMMSPNRSSLWHLLFRQGVVYFVVTCITNVITTVFLLLNLNQIMNLVYCIPAMIITSIVACRSFISLTTFLKRDVCVHNVTTHPLSCVTTVGGISGNDVFQICAGCESAGSSTKVDAENV